MSASQSVCCAVSFSRCLFIKINHPVPRRPNQRKRTQRSRSLTARRDAEVHGKLLNISISITPSQRSKDEMIVVTCSSSSSKHQPCYWCHAEVERSFLFPFLYLLLGVRKRVSSIESNGGYYLSISKLRWMEWISPFPAKEGCSNGFDECRNCFQLTRFNFCCLAIIEKKGIFQTLKIFHEHMDILYDL